MKLKCPHCQSTVSKKAIDRAGNYAICPRCHLSFDVGGRAADSAVSDSSSITAINSEFYSAEIPKSLIRNAPKGIRLKQDADGVVIQASMRSWLDGLGALLFSGCFFATVTFLVYIYFQNRTEEVTWWMLLVSLLFLLLGIALAGYAAVALFGKIEVVIGRESYLLKGVGALSRKKRFDWKAVKSIRAKTFIHYGPTDYRRTFMVIDGSSRIKFGGKLGGEKLKYIAKILNHLLENRA